MSTTSERPSGGVATEQLHLLRLSLVIVSVVVLGVGALGLLGVILLLLLGRLDLVQCLPLLSELIGLGRIIAHDDVVENGAALDLPQVEAQEAEICKGVHLVVVDVLRI